MTKPASSKSTLIKKWPSKYDANHFTMDGSAIFCQICNRNVKADKAFSVEQHADSVLHKGNLHWSDFSLKQVLLPKMQQKSTAQDIYNMELCEALLAADIPFHKLLNPVLKNFLEKYSKQTTPNPTTLRKNNVKKQYDKTIERIREDIGSNDFWVGVDETTDITGRYVDNVVIGALRNDRHSPSHLLVSPDISTANHQTIANTVDDTLRLLWPDSFSHKEKMLLLLTDSAAYMKKAAKTLQVFYQNMVHVTCLAHALHLVFEELRNNFLCVDKLIANVKEIFTKSPRRVAMYKSMCPGLPLPPKPVLTRWGTWLKAADFYRQNYADAKNVVAKLDPMEAQCIEKAQKLFENEGLCSSLAHLSANFTFLADSISKLEEQALPLYESVKVLSWS